MPEVWGVAPSWGREVTGETGCSQATDVQREGRGKEGDEIDFAGRP